MEINDVNNLRIEVMKNFVTKEELHELKRDVRSMADAVGSQSKLQAILGEKLDTQMQEIKKMSWNILWFTRSIIGAILSILVAVIVVWFTAK